MVNLDFYHVTVFYCIMRIGSLFGDVFREAVCTLQKGSSAFLLHWITGVVPITFSVTQEDPIAKLLYNIQLQPYSGMPG